VIVVSIGVTCARNPHSSQVASAVSSLGAGDIFLVPFHGALGLTGRSYRPRRLRRWHDARALRPNFLDAAEMGGAARLRAFLLVPHADDFGSRRSRDVLGLLRRDGPVNGPARPVAHRKTGTPIDLVRAPISSPEFFAECRCAGASSATTRSYQGPFRTGTNPPNNIKLNGGFYRRGRPNAVRAWWCLPQTQTAD
jgi:hypothetical protein